MKARVNLTIEQDILTKAKKYASEVGSSVSELVENYLLNISKTADGQSLVDYIDNLKVPETDNAIDFKKQYFEDMAQKHGN